MKTDFRPAIRRALQRECRYDFLNVRIDPQGKRSVFFPGLVRDAKTLGCHRNHPTGRFVRFPGLLNDAYELGEHRITLYLALSGKRTSKKYQDVLKRYRQLKGDTK